MFAATTRALVLADVGQLPDAGDVADRPQPLGHAQVRVDRDAVGVGLDADRLQADPLDARAPAGGDEQAVAAQLAAVVELEDVVVAVAARRGRLHAERELDPVAAQHLAERLAERCGLAGEHVRGALDERRPRRRGGERPAPARRRPGRRRARAGAAGRPSCRSPRGSSRRRRARAGPGPAARTGRRRSRARRARPCGGRRRPRPRRRRRGGRCRAAGRCRCRRASAPGRRRSTRRP